MSSMTWSMVLLFILSIVFIIGGFVNIFAPSHLVDDYRRWGYPPNFNLLTGALELFVAVSLLWPPSRLFGHGLGLVIIVAATGTLLMKREYTHAIAPIVILVLMTVSTLNMLI